MTVDSNSVFICWNNQKNFVNAPIKFWQQLGRSTEKKSFALPCQSNTGTSCQCVVSTLWAIQMQTIVHAAPTWIQRYCWNAVDDQSDCRWAGLGILPPVSHRHSIATCVTDRETSLYKVNGGGSPIPWPSPSTLLTFLLSSGLQYITNLILCQLVNLKSLSWIVCSRVNSLSHSPPWQSRKPSQETLFARSSEVR